MIEYRHEEGARLLKFFGDLKELKELIGEQKSSLEMFSDHWVEVADFQETVKLELDYDRYRAMIERGSLIIITARDEGHLIGYIVVILSPHLHYKSVLFSLEDVHYVDPKYRHQGIASQLIKESEIVLKSRGVYVATLRTKSKADHGALFEELGYVPLETIYGKKL